MSNLRFFLCGGTAINIGKALRESKVSVNIKNSVMVGLDSSDSNKSEEHFEVARMPGVNGDEARGSGKVQSTNYPMAVPFIKDVLSKHQPASFNVVVCNSSGGTGSMLGTLVTRELLMQDKPVVMVLIGDDTSLVEMKNSVNTMRSLAAQTSPAQCNKPIAFISVNNDAEHTRGETNAIIVNRLNLLSIFLCETNEEADYQDIKNLLNYPVATGVPATLSEIKFFNKEDALKHSGAIPVAVCSLFDSRDNVVPRFAGTTYRVTGVMNPINVPTDFEEIHMALDHGEALKALEVKVDELSTREANKTMSYVQHQTDAGDDNGMCFG